jgi:hypothetical protein
MRLPILGFISSQFSTNAIIIFYSILIHEYMKR